MGLVRHGCATTTHAIRAAIQRSQASLATLSREYGINPKTVTKWRKRATVEDLKTGPKQPRSTVLTEAEEAMIVTFRRYTQLPLDDCLLCAPADDSAPDALIAAPLSAAPRHLAPAGCRRCQAEAAALQALPDRVLSHRHRRGADDRREASSLRGH